MADTQREPELPDLPEAVSVPRRRWTPQLIWIIPIVAMLAGGWLAVKTILERGPTVTIGFKTAEGLEAGKTKIKYKDVDIGLVKEIALSKDRSRVVITAEIGKDAESLLVNDTRFWAVRPRLTASGVSGLGTLLSGPYITVDPGRSSQERREFVALGMPPIVTRDDPGREFVLRTEHLGSHEAGVPVYFRQLPVGEVIGRELDKDGQGVSIRVFVRAPYDQYVTANTRFWDASGIDLSLDATGIRLQTESLVSIMLRRAVRTGGLAAIAIGRLHVHAERDRDETGPRNAGHRPDRDRQHFARPARGLRRHYGRLDTDRKKDMIISGGFNVYPAKSSR